MADEVILRPYQAKALTEVEWHWTKGTRRVCLVAPTGCHARGQLVLMADGSTTAVENIEVGDKLAGTDNTTRTVLSLCRGHGEMFRVVPVKGNSFVVNGDHVLSLVRTNDGSKHQGGIVDVTVKEWLTWNKTDKHIHKLFREGRDWFGRVPEERLIDPYILGVLIGDGGLGNTSICITSADREILDAVSDFAGKHGMHLCFSGLGGSATTYRIVSKIHLRPRQNPLKQEISRLGLDCTSGGKFIPDQYKFAEANVRLETLAGLLDTDGHLHRYGYDYISKSERLANDVAFVARSLGLSAYVRACQKSAYPGHVDTYHRVSINGECSIIPCRVDRKRSPARGQKKDVLRTGFRIEPLGEDDFFGFTLDGNGRYLLDDFTVTHNSGKTVMANEFCAREPGAVLFVVHRTDLVTQTAGRFRERFGLVDVGTVIPRVARQPHARIQVGTVQTFNARGLRPDSRLVIFDEAHHYAAADWSTLFNHYAEARLLGLTATPERQDGKPLGDLFDALVVGAKHSQLLADGFLVSCKLYQPPQAMGSDLAQDPLLAYQKYGEDGQCFAFSADVEAAEKLAERFREAGITAQCIEAKTKSHDRKRWIAEFRRGDLRVITNVNTMTEGIDVPQARVILLAKPVRHVGQYLQIGGRVLRPHDTKPYAIFIDLVGATMQPEFGFPTDDREYSLDGEGIKRSGAPPVSVCGQCFISYPSRPGGCPECGFVAPVVEKELPRIWNLELKAVYAGEKTPDDAKAKEYARLRAEGLKRGWSLHFVREQYQKLFGMKPPISDATEEEQKEHYDRLIEQAESKGYKSGWVGYRFKDLFGKWPPRKWAA